MAIKAHLDLPAAGGGPRAASRRALRLETSGFVSGAGEANVTIHNISAAGLLLESDLALDAGEEFALDLPEAGVVTVTVVWRSERLYGCAFAAPLGTAALAAAQLQGFAPGVPERPAASKAAAPVRLANAGEALGSRLNRLRREAGLTLSDVAAVLGVSKPTVWAWEKGKARPLPERLDAIAAALGVEPDLLAPEAGTQADVEAVITACRERIAAACGAPLHTVRILLEL